MKKVSLLLFILISGVGALQAQTFAEWFQQKKTQKEYLLQQIVALQVYIGYAKKGYKIAKDGLNTISGFTNGEYTLHTNYFNSLKKVNPEVGRNPKVREMLEMQDGMLKVINGTRSMVYNSDVFNDEEKAYIRRVFDRIVIDCKATLDELLAVTSDDKLEMKDDERISRIEKLHAHMEDNYIFAKSFSGDVKMLAAIRNKEKNEVKNGHVIYGIPNL